ncbi:MAG: hypothetical protein LH606_03190 [Cytophagaceae bacterium]|nr:hypothetical protein [Cytophagaceae bacterium]
MANALTSGPDSNLHSPMPQTLTAPPNTLRILLSLPVVVSAMGLKSPTST